MRIGGNILIRNRSWGFKSYLCWLEEYLTNKWSYEACDQKEGGSEACTKRVRMILLIIRIFLSTFPV